MLTAVGTVDSRTDMTHDLVGRLVRRTQTTEGLAGTVPYLEYEYWASDAVKQTRYPSGRVVVECLDARMRFRWGSSVKTAQDCTGAATVDAADAYLKVNSYAPHGGVEELSYGNGLLERMSYNDRLQMTRLRAGTAAGEWSCDVNANDELCLEWGYGTSTNNGNVMDSRQWMKKTGGGQLKVSAAYGYDTRNRLTSFTETKDGGGSWGQTNGYDRYGNRWSVPVGVTQSDWAVSAQNWINASNNRLLLAKVGAGTGAVGYDNAGHMTTHPQVSGGLSYDVEGRLTSAGGAVYTYDGEGKRVKKTHTSGTTYYVYGAGGELAAEYGASDGAAGLQYLTVDALGSTRMTTNASRAVVARYDYWPFGEEVEGNATYNDRHLVSGYGGLGPKQKFTGKERDAETGLDYFGARYLSSGQGRFTSPDPINVNILRVINPQRWNMYVYGVNNPLAFTDPDGRDAIAVNFSKLAGGFGHSGIISVHRDGTATFGEFGPRGGGKPFFPGQYTIRPLQAKLLFGADGTPTKGSFEGLLDEISRDEGQPKDSISFAHFKTAEWETVALDAYLDTARQRQLKGSSPFYAVGFHDCRDFCLMGLRTAGVDHGHSSNANIPPNWIIGMLSEIADSSYAGGEKTTRKPSKNPTPDVKSKICFAGQPGC